MKMKSFVPEKNYNLFAKVLTTVRHNKPPPIASVLVLHGMQHSGRSFITDYMKHVMSKHVYTTWTTDMVEELKKPKLNLDLDLLDKRFIFLPEINQTQLGCLDRMHQIANKEYDHIVVNRNRCEEYQYTFTPGMFICTMTDSSPDQRYYTINCHETLPKMPMYFHFHKKYTKDQNSEDARLMNIMNLNKEVMQQDTTLCNDAISQSLKNKWD